MTHDYHPIDCFCLMCLGQKPSEQKAAGPKHCTECGGAWVHVLDAYYGDEPTYADMCVKCRDKRRKRK